ncbi:hypothetical protein, partial [Salmonella enterica]|uniref:hypothetical protein n=1 Tax=Salmonella enterica TaxID=28901 RepID=UPI003CF2F873
MIRDFLANWRRIILGVAVTDTITAFSTWGYLPMSALSRFPAAVMLSMIAVAPLGQAQAAD